MPTRRAHRIRNPLALGMDNEVSEAGASLDTQSGLLARNDIRA
jgi:hypothetical protein